jgi:sulfite dehydrogenase
VSNRREFIRLTTMLGGVGIAEALSGCGTARTSRGAHVVVVGGGCGGATAAKYLRMWSKGAVRVTLVERSSSFVSCPLSNLVIGGARQLAEITHGYDRLRSIWGVTVLQDTVTAIDPSRRRLRLASTGSLDYDRLVLAPGIEFMTDSVAGLAGHEGEVPHAWKAGPQTTLLRRQLEAMPDGGVFAIHIPRAPFRCPPGPYERACQAASYFRAAKPRSKVLILDANAEIQSKKALFMGAFEGPYKGIIDYRPDSELRAVDARSRTAELDFESVRADVLNVIPPQRASRLVDQTGAQLINERWAEVEWLSMEAKGVPGVHVLGDSVFPAPTMPKSGHMANQQAKVAAAAILDLLAGRAPNPSPVLTNACYSFVDARKAMHVASVHQYDAEKQTFLPVTGSGGLSPAASEVEGRFALAWANNLWADMLG